MNKKEHEEKLLQGIQSANHLMALVSAKKTDITGQLQPRKIQLKRLLLKDLRYLWILIFKHPIFPYGAKQDLIERLELNSSEKVTLCCGYTDETYKLSDI